VFYSITMTKVIKNKNKHVYIDIIGMMHSIQKKHIPEFGNLLGLQLNYLWIYHPFMK